LPTIEVRTDSGAPHFPTAHNCMLPQSNYNQNYSTPHRTSYSLEKMYVSVNYFPLDAAVRLKILK
jgi:hypothetical protein